MTRRVKIRSDAPHVPPEHRGEEARVVERKPLAFGQNWLRVRFADGCELWTTEERVEEVKAGWRLGSGGASGGSGARREDRPGRRKGGVSPGSRPSPPTPSGGGP